MAQRAIGDMAIFYGDKQNTGYYDNGVWMDLLDIPFIQKIEEASLYKVVIRTLWLEATGWSREIRNRYPEVIQIGLSDHPLSTHISKLPADRQHAYLSDLQYLDGIMALSEEERQWYQVALPSKPVIHAGLPFPFENYEKKFGKFRDSPKQWVGLGVGASDNDRNFVSNLLAFKLLKLKNPDLQGVFLSIPQQLISQTAFWADKIDGVYIHERTEMDEYLEYLSNCKFVINLADRNTPGRLQGEAAFLNIPVIGSNRLELQRLLYPDLAVSPYELEKVVELGQMLLDKPDEGTRLGKKAYESLKVWNYDNSRERFNKLLEEIKRRRS
jgi:hypothetical protein